MGEKENDWTALPPELIQIIAKKHHDLLDFIRFRATCKTWRSSILLSDAPPQLPWFLELVRGRYNRTNGIISNTQRFYSVSSCQTLTICLNQSKKPWSWITGGVFGYYFPFSDPSEDTLSFFNPLTKDQFSVPLPRLLHEYLVSPLMIWTGTDSIRERSIVVVDRDLSLAEGRGGWACYDPHSNKWVEEVGFFYYCCYLEGMLFSADEFAIEVFDASSKKLLHEILPLENEVTKSPMFDMGDFGWLLRKSYLVESLGVILRVSWFYDWDKGIVEGSTFYIYRLEFDGLDGQPCWVRVHNIGNQILFFAEMNGFSMMGRPSTGFREGCIYFIDPEEDEPYVHDILAGTVERVPCPFQRCTWFLPSLC